MLSSLLAAQDLGYMIGVVIGALLVGFLCGVIPLIVGCCRKNALTGLGLLCLCMFAGIVGGLPFAIPAGLVSILVAAFVPSDGAGCGIVVLMCILMTGAGYLFKKEEVTKAFAESLPDSEAAAENRAEPPVAVSEFRTFTSSDGRTMEARIVNLRGTTVDLIRRDGKTFSTALDRFSQADQEYIREHYPR